jgi:hypothetical protein
MLLFKNMCSLKIINKIHIHMHTTFTKYNKIFQTLKSIIYKLLVC